MLNLFAAESSGDAVRPFGIADRFGWFVCLQFIERLALSIGAEDAGGVLVSIDGAFDFAEFKDEFMGTFDSCDLFNLDESDGDLMVDESVGISSAADELALSGLPFTFVALV